MGAERSATLLSTADTARMLGVSTETLARAIRLGHLRAMLIGKQYAIALDDARTWHAQHYRPQMKRERARA